MVNRQYWRRVQAGLVWSVGATVLVYILIASNITTDMDISDAATILSEESIKPPCKRFHSGTCDFGDDCRFSHMTDEKRRQLEQQATRYKTGKEERQRGLVEGRAPSLDDWLKSYRRRRSDQSQGTDTGGKVVYQLPPFLATIPDVPPSLLPPTAEDLEHVHQVTWG